MKKILLLILALFLLTGCKANPKKFYQLNYGGETPLIVGYDLEETINGLDFINSYTTYSDKKERVYIESVEIYVDDSDINFLLDGQVISDSISENCTSLNGELVNKNGVACVLHKTYKKKENTVILTGDILADDIDKLDRIQILYK